MISALLANETVLNLNFASEFFALPSALRCIGFAGYRNLAAISRNFSGRCEQVSASQNLPERFALESEQILE